uniref:Uncharacterized protein n=1 Tax=Globodera rostochiensis TaxID=31243 RepID=A0A914HRU3_GLORO
MSAKITPSALFGTSERVSNERAIDRTPDAGRNHGVPVRYRHEMMYYIKFPDGTTSRFYVSRVQELQPDTNDENIEFLLDRFGLVHAQQERVETDRPQILVSDLNPLA